MSDIQQKPSSSQKSTPVSHEEPTDSSKSSASTTWEKFVAWRKSFGLPNPGPFEQLHKEVRGVFTNNLLFDGAKFDFSKGFSPQFQVTHSFMLGSQTIPSSYSFGGYYGGKNGFLHGTVDNEGSLQGRGQYALAKRLNAKFQTQLGAMPGQAMAQIEFDYSGIDYNLNAKCVNPSPIDGTGIYVGQYLQSLTKSLAVGAEVAYQNPQPDLKETQVSAVGKYSGSNWVFTSTLSQAGAVNASYFHQVSDQVELGAELQFVAAQNRREAVCTVGGKWEFRQAVFRGQVDTTGHVTAVIEEKMAPGFSMFFTGDLDHMKGQSKFGMGLQLES